MLGLEVGYTGHTRDGAAPELVFAITHAAVDNGTDVFPETMTGASITTARASVGVVF